MHSYAQVQAIMAALSVAAVGPFAQVFDELGLLLFVMGLLGGITGHFSVKLPLKTAWVPALVGGLLGFGLGIIAPPLLKGALSVDIVADGSPRGLAAVAYVVGIAHERVLTYLREGPRNAE